MKRDIKSGLFLLSTFWLMMIKARHYPTEAKREKELLQEIWPRTGRTSAWLESGVYVCLNTDGRVWAARWVQKKQPELEERVG